MDMYQIESELNNGIINEMATYQLDAFKVEGILSGLTTELQILKSDNLANVTTIHDMTNTISILELQQKDMIDIITKIGVDYPEIIISYPKFFTKEQK